MAVALAALPHLCGQSFDVASVKAVKPGTLDGSKQSVQSAPGMLTVRSASLSTCIKWAYLVTDYQISGPAWMNADRFDISAKAAGPAADDQLRIMLQALLQERFQLRLHRETKERLLYALAVGKSGPKLHKADPAGNTGMRISDGSFVFSGESMPAFAEYLSTLSQVDRPVLDRTGIAGSFDFSLRFGDTIADLKRALATGGNSGDAPSIFTVIAEQLGLVLEARKGPVEMLVIDGVERAPTEN